MRKCCAGIVVAGMVGMVWYIATWEAKAVLVVPSPPLKSQAELDEESRKYRQWQDVKDTIFAALLCIALAVGGLVLLALIAFSFTLDFTIAPTTVIVFLLFCILFKMERK